MKHLSLFLLALAVFVCLCASCSSSGTEEQEAMPSAAESVPEGPAAESLSFTRDSRQQITLQWPDDTDPDAAAYLILRSPLPETGDSWEVLAELPSDGSADGTANTWTDTFSEDTPQQYLYRIDLCPAGTDAAVPGEPVPVSNLLLCLDPGHYKDSAILGTDDGYNEGAFTIRIGLALRDELLRHYGISCLLTRESDSISLGGYSDYELDSEHIALRGEYAYGCDFFFSLHTNATQGNANGCPALSQPISICKPILLANTLAVNDDFSINLANAIGRQLTAVNLAEGIAIADTFRDAAPGALTEWTDEINDAPDQPGSVYLRLQDTGEDYYGVLRGAASVGVPGLIIEHGHHSVPEMRRAAMEGSLAQLWAQADAAGIAEGYGFTAYGEEDSDF